MTAEQFFYAVKEMRTAQKNYFKTRSSEWLKESKHYEREIDFEIERVINIKAKQEAERLSPTLPFTEE